MLQRVMLRYVNREVPKEELREAERLYREWKRRALQTAEADGEGSAPDGQAPVPVGVGEARAEN